ncbi:MAG: MFS transporter [Ardenticatenaceae bacterium]|nr:MFS transporter [Anaerolineales bacterium]MCB8922653.1 MFS transporter [Ardenticatenaceae bacterium]MCB9003639.1 MFS transporter [Ardenticatenaceae bacterium]
MTINTLSFRSLTATRNGRLLFFGLLYFVQGGMLAYVLVFNNLYLRLSGATAGQLSLLNGLLAVPFILKIAIGLLSDKVPLNLPLLGSGHRTPYMRLGLLAIAIGGSGAAFIHPVAQYPLFIAVALFIAFGLAFYDTVADGLAIDVTPRAQHEQVQGAMLVGRSLGFVMLAAVYGRLIAATGWQIVFAFVILFALLPLPLLARMPEPAERPAAQQFSWAALRGLWRPEIGRFALYAIVYSVAIYGTNAIIMLFANEELGGTLVQVGDVAALGGLGMVVGGLSGSLFGRRLSIWQFGYMTATAVSLTLLLIASVANLQNIAAITLLWGVALASAELVFLTLSMSKTDPRIGAGQFAIFMAISNVGTGIGQAAATGLIDTVDFHWIFVGMAAINLLTIPLLAAMSRDQLTISNEQ